MSAWLCAAQRLWRQGTAFVMVTIVATRGSVPREAGTRMLVAPGEMIGTIGGGHLEYEACEIARGLLRQPPNAIWRRFVLGPSLGQCCGGVVELLFEHEAVAQPGWLDIVAQQFELNEPVVVASVVERGYHARWVVTARGVWSNGVAVEYVEAALVTQAREILATPCARTVLTDASTPDADGARSLLFMERVARLDLHVVLFGAGHVGRALIGVLGALPCRVTWVDGREAEFCNPAPDNVVVECTDTPEAEIASAAPSTCFLVMTHSHALDFSLTAQILQRGDFRYFGLIGSVTKRKSFERRLRARGVLASAVERMRCPVGIAGIVGKEPGVIAVAVAAELLLLRESRVLACAGQDGLAREHRSLPVAATGLSSQEHHIAA